MEALLRQEDNLRAGASSNGIASDGTGHRPGSGNAVLILIPLRIGLGKVEASSSLKAFCGCDLSMHVELPRLVAFRGPLQMKKRGSGRWRC